MLGLVGLSGVTNCLQFKRNDMKKINKYLMCTVAAASIAACGGGGGGSTGGVAAPAAPVVQVTAQLVTSVPTPTYGAASEELIAFNYLNAERARCGFGKLAQSVPLDKAAKAHADYQLINTFLGHFENARQFPNGYTGGGPADRATFQGYVGIAEITDELTGYLIADGVKTGKGKKSIQELLGAPYHALGILGGYRDIGIAVRNNLETGTAIGRVIAQYKLAYKATDARQDLPKGSLSTYPCNGTIDVERALYDESPSPVPGRNLRTSPLGALTIYRAGEGDILEIVSVTYTKKSDGQNVVLRAPLTSTNNPNTDVPFRQNEASVIADVAMSAKTTYIRNSVLKLNGVPITDVTEFTTGM